MPLRGLTARRHTAHFRLKQHEQTIVISKSIAIVLTHTHSWVMFHVKLPVLIVDNE